MMPYAHTHMKASLALFSYYSLLCPLWISVATVQPVLLLTGLLLSWESAVRSLPGQASPWATLLVTEFILMSDISFAQAQNEQPRRSTELPRAAEKLQTRLVTKNLFLPLSNETNVLPLWFCHPQESCMSFSKIRSIGNFSRFHDRSIIFKHSMRCMPICCWTECDR